MKISKEVAKVLLETKAVRLSVEEPFTFVSGIKSPIYCDNRKVIGEVDGREIIINGYLEALREKEFDVVAGTATAGIPWASWIGDRLKKPVSYIRSAKKGYGAGRQIEGASLEGKKVVVIEDLISTGGSSIKAVESAREEGALSVEVFSIFTYEFEKAVEAFDEVRCKYHSLSNFTTLMDVATELGYIKEDEKEVALKWNQSPSTWKKG